MKNRFQWLMCIIGCVSMLFTSCVQTKNITYFSNLPDSLQIELNSLKPPQPLIQINDILEIQIGGENEKTVEYITQYFTGGNHSIQTSVDINGYIELPKIGRLKVNGLTREEVRDTITNAYKEYLVDPLVGIKFGNFRFTIMGEVRSPGNFDVTNEKISIFEALAKAGDLTPYAKADDVKIIREVNDKREVITINLNDKSLLNSPNYYLNRYDLIYVKPQPLKSVNENLQRSSTYFAAITSVLAILFIIFRR